MRLRILGALVMTLTGVSIVTAADASFTGTWKLNLSKSQLTGQTVTLSKTTSGTMHYDSQGFAYDFDLTGKEIPDAGWRNRRRGAP